MTTAQPSNTSEWQLYRVLQRANLLQYYETFVAQGGDDVQQLCEAGEEEFLEIMALVGMASKPLHVRRLQKSLQEWVANPTAFQGPSNSASPSSVSSLLNTPVRDPPTQVRSLPNTQTDDKGVMWLSQAGKNESPENVVPLQNDHKLSPSPTPNPVLTETQISMIAQSAARLVPHLPHFEMKRLSLKKEINREIHALLEQPKDGPDRLEAMRKYGCIYGRYDSKRKNDRPMSLHEISVNEAAAQLCYHIPNLLTRREDLFPLAREVVKNSGYQYSKGHSRATDFNPTNPSKKLKLDVPGFGDASPYMKAAKLEMERASREERLSVINKELSTISTKQEEVLQQLESAKEGGDNETALDLQNQLEQITNKHLQLLTEQSDTLRKQSEARELSSQISNWLSTHTNQSAASGFKTDSFYSDYLSDMEKDDSNIPSGSSSPTQQPRDPSLSTIKSLLSSINPENCSKDLKDFAQITQNSLFDEGLRIAQQFGLADFAEEIQQLKGDNSTDDLSTSKNSNDNSLNQSIDNDSAEKLSEDSKSSDTVKTKDLVLENVKEEVHVNGN